MPRANEQKIKLLVLYDILQRETDEEHPLSTNEIIERLSERGIEVSRKILPGDIALLNKYGFEILSYKKKSHYASNRAGMAAFCVLISGNLRHKVSIFASFTFSSITPSFQKSNGLFTFI